MPVAEGFRVATAYVALTIDEGDVQGAIEAAITEACAKAGDDGGTLLTEEIASAVDGVAPDLSAPLIDSLAGAGDAAAAEIASALTSEIAGAGDDGGAELAASLEAATADVGAEIADRVGGQLETALPEQASAAAAEMAAELTAGTADVGGTIATTISRQLTEGLDAAAQAGATALRQLSISGAAGVAGAGIAGAGIVGALSASVIDAAAEAGGIAGAELSRNLSEAAVAALSDEQFAAFTDMLVATASEAGDAAGVAAADALGAGFADASAGLDLIAAGLSTVGQSMTAAADQFVSASNEILEAERTVLTGTQAYEAELDATFEAIFREGDGMTVRLAAAMVETFQGIETDTRDFTWAEVRIFTEFYQTLQEQGDQAAMAFAERASLFKSSALLGVDMIGQNLSTTGAPMAALGGATKELGGVEEAAGAATASVGGLAGVMGGPLMWGILGVASILPMFSGLLGGNSQAAQQAAQMHQQLAQSIAQDSGAVGDNTAAVIQASLAQSNLNDLSQQLGLTQVQLIEYAAGEADVQQQVADAYSAKTDQLDKTAGTTTEYGKVVVQVNNQSQIQLNTLADQKGALDGVTSSVLHAINANRNQVDTLLAAEHSTAIYTAAVADLVSKQKLQAEQSKMQADATLTYLSTLIPGTQAYTDAIDVQIAALDQNRVNAQINAQAFNDLLPIQGQLSDAALQASQEYQAAGTAASAYKLALDSLYGRYGDLSEAQAQFTTSLDNLKGKITDGRDAVDLNTAAGAKNFEQFKQSASAAENYAEQLYKQTGDAGQATSALKDMATKLDDAARHAGFTKQQVQDLNKELFGVPDIKTISIQADQSPAHKVMSALDTFIKDTINGLNHTPITPSVDMTKAKSEMYVGMNALAGILNTFVGNGLPTHATGGPVRAGAPVLVGDGGRTEVFVPNSDGRIYPSVGDGARAMAQQGGGGTFNFNYYGTQHPTPEQRQIMMRDLALANRGGISG